MSITPFRASRLRSPSSTSATAGKRIGPAEPRSLHRGNVGSEPWRPPALRLFVFADCEFSGVSKIAPRKKRAIVISDGLQLTPIAVRAVSGPPYSIYFSRCGDTFGHGHSTFPPVRRVSASGACGLRKRKKPAARRAFAASLPVGYLVRLLAASGFAVSVVSHLSHCPQDSLYGRLRGG